MASTTALSLTWYPHHLISHVSHKLASVLAHTFIRGCQNCTELAEDWRFGNQAYIISGSGLLRDLGLLGGRDKASFLPDLRPADEMHHFQNEGNTLVLA